ncbi:hypothetical protein A0128_01320 [Leptospira tipperaryensis]|uniref:DUF1570 domain-containing protein n=1 Tax=Leptospira tipperaryensis TaxID=2564040 RepID=A0A1D7USM0_9LEPT|nr:hypothetical protein [Leptospira tipperaryensis]AOP32629.1 hypothetical protein A0128_01320 [Leptospira tipperaryensis]
MKRFGTFLFFTCFTFSIFSETIRYKVDGFEFYFLNEAENSSATKAKEIIRNFADQFILESVKESERLNLKKPSEAFIFIAENSKVFAQISGQPSFVAARFLSDSNRFYFQNPNTLYKRNILSSSIRHEICHFLSPHLKEQTLQWIEESYCEALYPTNSIVSKKFLDFPKSWEQFKKINLSKNSKKEEELKKYKLLASWGDWILKDQGEIRFRNLLENQTPENEWKILYSKFLKSR